LISENATRNNFTNLQPVEVGRLSEAALQAATSRLSPESSLGFKEVDITFLFKEVIKTYPFTAKQMNP
jgi:hypothetical protein